MAANARQYREHLYRLRTHPESLDHDDFVDQRDSFLPLYLSLVPFLMLEYAAELSYEVLPSGLIFPLGFLLFWAFFYTFYKPGFLEDRLSSPQKWDLIGIPTVLMGVLIWFVKVTVVELSGFFVRALFGLQSRTASEPIRDRRRKARPAASAPPPPHRESSQAPPHARAGRATGQSAGGAFRPSPTRPKSSLPRDIIFALHTLGLGEDADWGQIHRRYRELAKQYHPDLNREITAVGRRFMIYDAAYRKLASVKVRYFPEKRSHG